MKKIIKYFFVIIIVLAGLSKLYGQEALNKGVYSIGGSAQYSSSSENNNYNTITINTANISPQFTYFIIDHLSLGAAVNYNYYFNEGSSYSNSGEHNIKTTYITLGPAIRYYFYAKRIIPFLEASFNYGIYGLEQDYPEHTYNYGLKVGIDFFLSGSVALEPSIGYNHIHYSTDFGFASISADSDNFEVGIGVNYYIF